MTLESTLLFVPGAPGGIELVVIVGLAVLLFGASKIPKLARSIGRAQGEFLRGREQINQEVQELRESTGIDEVTESVDEVTGSAEEAVGLDDPSPPMDEPTPGPEKAGEAL